MPILIRDILESGAFVATIVTGVVAVVALKQLKIALHALAVSRQQLDIQQQDIEIRSKRESGVLAAKLCEKFAFEVIPAVESLSKTHGLATGKPFDFLFNEIPANDQWYSGFQKNPSPVTAVLNKIEAIAIFFDRGLADEEVAYPSLGREFCNYCEMLWPAIAHFRPVDGPHLFQSTVAHYRLWKPRLEKGVLLNQEKRIKQKIYDLPDSPPQAPIGAKIKKFKV